MKKSINVEYSRDTIFKNQLFLFVGPTTPNCPLICSQECNDDELLCPGGTDPNGCYENDFCHPKGTGNEGQVCPGFCPFECPEDKLKCPSPALYLDFSKFIFAKNSSGFLSLKSGYT